LYSSNIDLETTDLNVYDYLSSIKNGLFFNCVEQWMMASKAITFNDVRKLQDILWATDPSVQKNLGRLVSGYNQEQWDRVKFNVVYVGCMEKFKQNKDLKEFLLSFPIDTIFAEAAPWDSIWGIGLGPTDKDALNPELWPGENLLGKVIQKVRKTI